MGASCPKTPYTMTTNGVFLDGAVVVGLYILIGRLDINNEVSPSLSQYVDAQIAPRVGVLSLEVLKIQADELLLSAFFLAILSQP
eukprot:7807857-Ditylum_brightwellii.AAC.1